MFCDNGAAVSLIKRSQIPANAPRRYGCYEAEGIGGETVKLLGDVIITLRYNEFQFEFRFWVCEDTITLQEDMLIGLDFMYAFRASVNCNDLSLDFPEFSIPLTAVRSKSIRIRALFPASPHLMSRPEDKLASAPAEPQARAAEASTALVAPRGPGGVCKREKSAAGQVPLEEEEENEDPLKERSYRTRLGEFPVMMADRVTLPPSGQTVVYVRPHKAGARCHGMFVIEPDDMSRRPGLHVAFTLVKVTKGQPFPLVLCNLSNENLPISRNMVLGYLVKASVDDKLPSGTAPIKKVSQVRTPQGCVPTRDTVSPGVDAGGGPDDPAAAREDSQPAADGRARRPDGPAIAPQVQQGTAWGAAKRQPHGRQAPPPRAPDEDAPPPPSPAELLARAKLGHLDAGTRRRIEDIIAEFSDVFALTNERIGKYPGLKHKIPTEPGQIIRRASYRIPYALRNSFQEEINRLLRLGIIVRSNSEWSNPCMFLVKIMPDGTQKPRLIIDARGLNRITLPSVNYNTRTIAETLDFLAGKLYLSKADVVSAFHCVELDEKDAEKTAFTGLHGQRYHYKRGCFGLRDMPFTFQMAVDMALCGVRDAVAYYDDLVMASTSLDGHLETLRNVFMKLRLSSLTIRIDKCEFLPEKLHLLGFEIFDGKIQPDKTKLAAVDAFQAPSDKTGLKSFLGLASFMRRHIRRFAAIARPLNRLIRPKTPYIWTKIEDTAFQALKDKLTKEPVVLHLPDLTKPFKVITDCSGYCQGAILAQSIDGKDRVIAYASAQLTKGETKRSATEREMGCIVWALKHWRLYLLGASGTTVHTDHRPLLHLKVDQDHSALLTRLLAKTIPYDITLHYLPGNKMPSDILSRPPQANDTTSAVSTALADPAALRDATRTVVPDGSIPSLADFFKDTGDTRSRRRRRQPKGARSDSPPRPAVRTILPPRYVDRATIQAAQATDTECQAIMSNIKLCPEFAIINGVLVGKDRAHGRRALRPFVPVTLRPAVIRQHHQVGHLAARKTLAEVGRHWVFPKMSRAVAMEVRACKECAARNTPYQVTNAPLMGVPICSRPMQGVEIDLVGPLPTSSKGHDHILSIKCQFSKYVIFVPLKKTDSETICHKLEKHLIARWGCPEWLKSDNGPNLCSSKVNSFLEELHIKKVEILPYSPQANSVEASHKTLGNILSKLVSRHKRDWPSHLPRVTMAMNGHVHDSHGFQPHELMTGKPFRCPWPDIVQATRSTPESPKTYAEAAASKTASLHAAARERLTVSSEARIAAKNKNRFWREYAVHDLVMYKDPRLPSGKLQSRWRGPLRITKRHTQNAYQIQELQPPYCRYDVPLRSIKTFYRTIPLWFEKARKSALRTAQSQQQRGAKNVTFLPGWKQQEPPQPDPAPEPAPALAQGRTPASTGPADDSTIVFEEDIVLHPRRAAPIHVRAPPPRHTRQQHHQQQQQEQRQQHANQKQHQQACQNSDIPSPPPLPPPLQPAPRPRPRSRLPKTTPSAQPRQQATTPPTPSPSKPNLRPRDLTLAKMLQSILP